MTTTEQTHWYHAGSVDPDRDRAEWSRHSRRTYDRAVREARRIARVHGGRPVVEVWAKRHGPHPGDCELVESAAFVDE